ncbi:MULTISPECIES: DUF4174 domain-containing protein [Roseobacteraceae]|uniref:DUF4174 domain-containing protein n=1 Tax=Pseudosulfitobacter pseudonitzschiae TaxID=1402135 RepID=A0A221JXM3_9RHOB|nr:MULTISPECIES: DUF4174 domain-containing protein [Roseobacteraceae]ASM71492.1 hypothetical protein SULPSESMR1_00660 [Pseudosulfitobacter pseudonitzschiae]
MKRLIPLVFIALGAFPAMAEDTTPTAAEQLFATAAETDLRQFVWTNRPIVVFADSPADPKYIEQVALLRARAEDLLERDVVVLLDTDPDARSELRQKLRPRGYMMALIDKDGDVMQRKPFPWDVREITRSIDKTPTRQQELRGAAQPEG